MLWPAIPLCRCWLSSGHRGAGRAKWSRLNWSRWLPRGGGGWLVTKVNTEDLPVLAQRFHVNSIPAFALLKSGREVARQAGAMPAQAIRQFIEKGQGVGRTRQ